MGEEGTDRDEHGRTRTGRDGDGHGRTRTGRDGHMGDWGAEKLNKKLAFWALTPGGGGLALGLLRVWGEGQVFVSERTGLVGNDHVQVFESLSEEVGRQFHRYSGHVFFMATGIVVRMIAPLIVHKTQDPAVVVVDDHGAFAISLLSGHIGGANQLAYYVAEVLGAQAVITTASDVNNKPSVDMMAVQKNLVIENPEAIKTVNMALLLGNDVGLWDPYGYFKDQAVFKGFDHCEVRVCVDHRINNLPVGTLILRPKTLVAGIGCNRGTDRGEIRELLFQTLAEHDLSPLCLAKICSVDIKKDEAGICDLAQELNCDLGFFTPDELGKVETIETPSMMVQKHIGVKSVCEAAAILGAAKGTLIVPKRKSKNATVALARINFTS